MILALFNQTLVSGEVVVVAVVVVVVVVVIVVTLTADGDSLLPGPLLRVIKQ